MRPAPAGGHRTPPPWPPTAHCGEAGLPGSLHALRHAHATALLQARLNPRAVQARLGHANISTTLAVYAHAMPGDDDAAAAAIGAALSTTEAH